MSYALPISPSPRDTEKELRNRMPRLQTSTSTTTSHAGSKAAVSSRTGIEQMKSPTAESAHPSRSSESAARAPSASLQRFVLTDPVAFRYLEEDPSTTVLSRRERLQGYESYLVEQWACSRIHPTFIITTYTGDPKDSVWASVISVPKDESEWSPQMRILFKALDKYHARKKETSLGTLMITNLSGFPSSLTLIPIPEGNITANRDLFRVNENLKRLGCSGRLGIKLATPSSAAQAKFHQLYRTSDKIPLNSSVIELVKLCQVALVLFGQLEPEYADGLLCDVTEKAVNDWWIEFGSEYYTAEPHDGILGPTTVAALLGMLMGARNRLSAYNAPVAKDVFEIESTMRGISHFQKMQRIQKTRRLDRQTLERLRRATAKAASKESWAVPRAFKTTVAELGGKGGEMVMGMVGAGDKAGIADIETVDIERFVELVSGERAKWLWHGKPRKTNSADLFSRLPGEERSASPDEHQHITKLLKRESTLEAHATTNRNSVELGKRPDVTGTADTVDKERDPNSKRAVIKRATDKIESGSGFHRLKDVVGRRNHQPKPSRDEAPRSPVYNGKSDSRPSIDQVTNDTRPSRLNKNSRTSDDLDRTAKEVDPTFTKVLTQTPQGSASTLSVDKIARPQIVSNHESAATLKQDYTDGEESKPPTVDNSVAGSIYRGIDPDNKLQLDEVHEVSPRLRRTQSSDQLDPYHSNHRNDEWWPRHLSFSIAEESVLTWRSLIRTSAIDDEDQSTRAAFASQQVLLEEAKRLRHQLALISSLDATWVSHHLKTITDLDARAEGDALQLENLYYPAFESYQSLREDAHEIVSSNRTRLNEAVRELGTLSEQLEYEIGGLRSRVDDAEDGVAELDKQVEDVEERIEELERELGAQKEGWLIWTLHLLTGIGR